MKLKYFRSKGVRIVKFMNLRAKLHQKNKASKL